MSIATRLDNLTARLDDLERENARLLAHIAALTPHQSSADSTVHDATSASRASERTSRRGVLRTGLKAAVATVGAGVVVETRSGTALATGAEGPTTFTSTTTTPAVQAKNTGGGSSVVAITTSAVATIKATNNGSGSGIIASSSIGTGLVASSSSGSAVTATNSSSSAAAVSAANSSSGNAVLGTSTAYTGIAGKTTSTAFTAAGVFGGGLVGVAGSTTGATTAPSQPVGVYGTGSNASSLGIIGVQGDSDTNSGVVGNSLSGWGVVGRNATTNGSNGGVNGASTSGIGVWGYSNSGPGVAGQCTSNYGVSGYSVNYHGVVGQTQSTGGYGVWGIGNGGYGVFCSGDFAATGTKSAIVPFPDGSHRQLYCLESPECWFEDFGTAALIDGMATVPLDPGFAAAVLTHDYHIFLTAEGDSHGLYVSGKDNGGFSVREQNGGASTLTFSYRVVARRKDIVAPRLKEVTLQKPLPVTLQPNS